MPFMRLRKLQREALELEIVPAEARLELTRIIRFASRVPDESEITILRENRFINLANTVLGNPIYILDGGQDGEYHPAEYAWHNGQIELIMRVPSTSQLAEILADYLQHGLMATPEVNQVLKRYSCGFSYKEGEDRYDRLDIGIEITDANDIAEVDLKNEHPNIRKLVTRMDASLEQKDYPAVLHASASVFETLAKDVTGNPNVLDKSLGSFFEAYRKKSNLLEPVLDYIIAVFNARNTEPLAGHGKLAEPTIDAAEAVVLTELTKSIVRMERTLALQTVSLKGGKA